MPFHIDAQAVEYDSFCFEAQALLKTVFATEKDFTARADHALPRHAARLMERPGDLSRGAGKPGGISDIAIRRDFSFGNPAHLAQD